MKTMSKILMSALVLSAVATPTTIFAADGGIYNSNGQVEFTPSTDPTNPVDPTDPTNPVKPTDPTNPDGPKPGTAGPLSIDFASSLDFGKQKITSEDQHYLASAQGYYALDENGTPSDTLVYGPDYVQVTDNRGTLAGWTLKVKQDKQFTNADTGHVLDGAAITLTKANIVTASTAAKPTVAGDITLIPGQESLVMSATAGQGAGTYLTDWGTKDELTSDNTTSAISLFVPGSTTKYAEKYTTQLVWTLSDTPGNTTEAGA